MLCVKCLLCGRESEKPICPQCTGKVVEERPFLVKRSMLYGESDIPLDRALEMDMLFDSHIEELNSMAKKALQGKRVSNTNLALGALHFHRHYSFYLRAFSLPETYYLDLAERFASQLKGERGRYIMYQILREKGDEEGAKEILRELAEKYGGRYAKELQEGWA